MMAEIYGRKDGLCAATLARCTIGRLASRAHEERQASSVTWWPMIKQGQIVPTLGTAASAIAFVGDGGKDRGHDAGSETGKPRRLGNDGGIRLSILSCSLIDRKTSDRQRLLGRNEGFGMPASRSTAIEAVQNVREARCPSRRGLRR